MGACLRPQADQPTGKPDVVQLRTKHALQNACLTPVSDSHESSYRSPLISRIKLFKKTVHVTTKENILCNEYMYCYLGI